MWERKGSVVSYLFYVPGTWFFSLEAPRLPVASGCSQKSLSVHTGYIFYLRWQHPQASFAFPLPRWHIVWSYSLDTTCFMEAGLLVYAEIVFSILLSCTCCNRWPCSQGISHTHRSILVYVSKSGKSKSKVLYNCNFDKFCQMPNIEVISNYTPTARIYKNLIHKFWSHLGFQTFANVITEKCYFKGV